jgi:general nucleoside transport system permease protein
MIVFFQVLFRVLTSADLWQATLVFATLLVLPALGGVMSERSGVVNIAMEGMMLTGAYAAVMTAQATHSVWGGVIGAMIAGGLMALIHAVVSINFKANQIVSGIAINIFALGLTNYLLLVQTQGQGVQSLPAALRLPTITWGPLANIPFLGQVLFQQNIIFYVALLILVGIQFLLFRTNIGLRIRAVGERPQAADTAGVNVYLVRYLCVISSGVLSGLGGAFLSLGIAGIFNSNITAGAGFIALAAMIFGKYTPLGTAGACLLFGLGDALAVRMQDTGISPYLLSTIPYVLTLVALVGLVGRTIPPAADGIPYEPGTE